MVALLREVVAASPGRLGPLPFSPRQSNDFVDRRALADVMSVMDSVHPQGSDEEIWMISYMDIMTLLLTLFVLLLAFAKIVPQSIQLAPTVQAAKHAPTVKSKSAHVAARTTKAVPVKPQSSLSHAAVLPTAIATPAQHTNSTESPVAVPALTAFGIAAPADVIAPPLKAAPQNVVPLRQEPPAMVPAVPAAVVAREKLLASVRTGALGRRIELSVDQNNVNLEISDNILFDAGSATLKQNGQQLLNELAALLTAQDYMVSIEGHSDNVPFANAHFASNWELSATRATNVTRYLIARGIAAARLRAIGYADTQPRADNTSEQGRARNRRVSLVLHMPIQVQEQPPTPR